MQDRSGSKAALTDPKSDFRFTPSNGHPLVTLNIEGRTARLFSISRRLLVLGRCGAPQILWDAPLTIPLIGEDRK